MMFALLIALLLPAGDRELVDLGPVLRPAPDHRAPRLGPIPLSSFRWKYEEEPPEEEGEEAEDPAAPYRLIERAGRWTTAGRIVRRRFHADDDVEIACSGSPEAEPSWIVDPIVRTGREGFAVDLRPSQVTGGEGLLIEAVAQAGRFAPGPRDLTLAARGHGRIEIPAAAGRTAVARVGTDEMAVVDWDVEVGCYSQVGDPDVDPVFTGDMVRLTPLFSPDGRAVCIELEVESRVSDVPPPSPSGMVVTGAVHPIPTRRRPLHAELVLRDNEPVRLPLGPGRKLEVCARGLLLAEAAPK